MTLFLILFTIIIILEYYVRKKDMLVKDKIFYWVFSAIAAVFSYWYFLNEYRISFAGMFWGGI